MHAHHPRVALDSLKRSRPRSPRGAEVAKAGEAAASEALSSKNLSPTNRIFRFAPRQQREGLAPTRRPSTNSME